MTIRTTVVGSYPKPPNEGETFVVRKTIHGIDKGATTVADLHAAQDELVRTILSEEESAGIDLITDGHARWDDLLTPFAAHMAGFEIGGLMRWFDNNVYYRRPICSSDLEWRGPASVDAFRFASENSTKTVKAVIPGPVTFAHLSVDEHYNDHSAFVLAIAGVLAQEAFELEAAGAEFIQIDQPALLGAPEDIDLAREAIGIITGELKSSETKTLVATYFGDAKRLGADLFTLPVDGFGLDLRGRPGEQVADLVPAPRQAAPGGDRQRPQHDARARRRAGRSDHRVGVHGRSREPPRESRVRPRVSPPGEGESKARPSRRSYPKGRCLMKKPDLEGPGLWTTSVGSLPKSPEILAARSKFARGEIERSELLDLERAATKDWIEFQDSIGTDVVVDGEIYRGDMVAYFAEEMPGLEIGGLVRSYGNRYYRKPIATGPVDARSRSQSNGGSTLSR